MYVYICVCVSLCVCVCVVCIIHNIFELIYDLKELLTVASILLFVSIFILEIEWFRYMKLIFCFSFLNWKVNGRLGMTIEIYQSFSGPSVRKEKHNQSMLCFRFRIELATEGSFCFGFESKKRITLIEDNIFTERVIGWKVIGYYFHCGYSYKTIVHLLKTYCDI